MGDYLMYWIRGQDLEFVLVNQGRVLWDEDSVSGPSALSKKKIVIHDPSRISYFFFKLCFQGFFDFATSQALHSQWYLTALIHNIL
jgi:hypothetical protein